VRHMPAQASKLTLLFDVSSNEWGLPANHVGSHLNDARQPISRILVRDARVRM
jgi:hypothetical protein